MANSFPGFFRRSWRLGGRTFDSLSVLFCLIAALFFCLWHDEMAGHFSLKAVGVYVGLCAIYMVYGRIVQSLTPFLPWARAGLPLRFLFGFFFFNTLLFLVSIAFSFTMTVDAVALAVVGLAVMFLTPASTETTTSEESILPAFLCLLISGIAATFLCRESLEAPLHVGGFIHYRVWPDAFFHAREITLFAHAQGLSHHYSPQMSGVPAPVYHYAIYTAPAAVAALGNWNALAVYLNFMVPFGIVLIGLAAYALTASIWGPWAGLCGAAGLLLFPDAYSQGFGNKFMSFFFLEQVSPGLMFGVACAALCWIAMLEGCRKGHLPSVLLAYVLLGVSLTYRAHIFVANAYLVLIYPCLFFTQYRAKWRILVAVALTALFWGLTAATRDMDSVPTLRLNGKSAEPYLNILALSSEPGPLDSLLLHIEKFHPHSQFWTFFRVAMMVFLWVFGLWGVVFLCSPTWLRAKPWPAAYAFPYFILVNFLVMSVGLEMDQKKVRMPEELLHRPFVWAYFVVVAWVAAGIYASCFGDKPPASRAGKYGLGVAGLALLFVPMLLSRNAQVMPAWPTTSDFKVLNVVPEDLVKASSYIRDHHRVDDIVLDSDGDPNFEVSGLAECQDFVVQNQASAYWAPDGVAQRQAEVLAFERLPTTPEVQDFARRNNIDWIVIDPDSKVAWPESFLQSAVYQRGGYRVYFFGTDNRKLD